MIYVSLDYLITSQESYIAFGLDYKCILLSMFISCERELFPLLLSNKDGKNKHIHQMHDLILCT